MHARRESTHPSLTLAYDASPTRLLERWDVRERQGELGADFLSFDTVSRLRPSISRVRHAILLEPKLSAVGHV